MSRDVLELANSMDRQGLEWQTAVQCAPLITGLKVSNLMMLPASCENSLLNLLAETDISCFELGRTGNRVSLLLYREADLEARLMQEANLRILREEGYTGCSVSGILTELANRYAECRNGRCVFPHEMGVFLGYPEEDVRGFIRNRGQHFLMAGYWKVYADAEAKKKLFDAYNRASDTMIRLLHAGRSLPEIIRLYKKKRDRYAGTAA